MGRRKARVAVPNVLYLRHFSHVTVKTLNRLSMKRNPDESLSRPHRERRSRPAFPRDARLAEKAAAICVRRSGDDVRAERPADFSAGLLARYFYAFLQENREKRDSLCASRRKGLRRSAVGMRGN